MEPLREINMQNSDGTFSYPRIKKTKDWIVVAGSLVDSTKGGGLEFLGPYTELDALIVCTRLKNGIESGFDICFSVQLIRADLPERLKAEYEANIQEH